MAEWAPKRFWTSADVAESEAAQGWQVLLDGRVVKTPAKRPLVVPTCVMAHAIAAEWDAQGDTVDPATMPVTRSANAAIDKVAIQFEEVADLVADYGGSDLLCYRAASPVELVARQAEAWTPLLDWAREALDAPLDVTTGVMPIAQPTESLANLHAGVHALHPFELTAFSEFVALTGSLVMGFAAARGAQHPDALWHASRVDELWQIEQWGPDDEAQAVTDRKKGEFDHAVRFFALASEND